MVWLVPVVLSTVLAGPAGPVSKEPPVLSPARRVRAIDPIVQDLLNTGINRSRTFAKLVTALNATDVIAYVERVRELPDRLQGRLLMLPVAGGQRYVRIQVRSDLATMDLIALIGHELRHALEIADHPSVRDAPGMLTLYQRIGHPTSRTTHTFDTEAAQTAGRQVRLELAS
jgi:hypothetical protein